MWRLTMTVALALALAGCGGTSDGGTNSSGASSPASSTSATSSTATPPSTTSTSGLPASTTSDDPQVVAESLKEQIPAIGAVVKVTEENDSNNLIGRPGKYDAASFMKDTRVTCRATELKDLSTSCGAKVERWPSNEAAQARADYIQKALEAMPMLGTEYDYVRDGLLLRVAGGLKPSQAKEYERAFTG